MLTSENEARHGPYELEVRKLIDLVERGEASGEELDALLDRGPLPEQMAEKARIWDELSKKKKTLLIRFLEWFLKKIQ